MKQIIKVIEGNAIQCDFCTCLDKLGYDIQVNGYKHLYLCRECAKDLYKELKKNIQIIDYPYPSINSENLRYKEISDIYHNSNLGYTSSFITTRIRIAYDEGWSDERIKSDIKDLSDSRDRDEHFIQVGHY